MKNKLKQLLDKKHFITEMAIKLNIEKKTLNEYFEKDNIPLKHKETINEHLDRMLIADEKIKQIRVEVFEKL